MSHLFWIFRSPPPLRIFLLIFLSTHHCSVFRSSLDSFFGTTQIFNFSPSTLRSVIDFVHIFSISCLVFLKCLFLLVHVLVFTIATAVADAKDIAVFLFPLLLFAWPGHAKAHSKNTNTSMSMHWRVIPRRWLRDDILLIVILWLLEILQNNISAQSTTCLKAQNERMITMARIVGTQRRTDGTELPTALWNETILNVGWFYCRLEYIGQ